MISKNITTRTTVFAPDGSNNNRNNNNGDLLWRGFGAERRSKMATGGEKWRGFVCERDTGTRMYRYSTCLIQKKTYCTRVAEDGRTNSKWYGRYPVGLRGERQRRPRLQTNDTRRTHGICWTQRADSNYVSKRKGYVIGTYDP